MLIKQESTPVCLLSLIINGLTAVMDENSNETFEKAKELFMSAMESFFTGIKSSRNTITDTPAAFSSGRSSSNTSSSSSGATTNALSEHKRLFGFDPSKRVYGKSTKRKWEDRGPGKGRKRKAICTSKWKKECICERYCEMS